MDKWLAAAIDYVPRWLDFQMRLSEQPGMVVAIAHKGKVILEKAYGMADLGRGIELTPRHRFRVASHSKSFTAAAVMKLREQGKLRLDDPAGRYVDGLHRAVADTTIGQLLSHGAGIIRDGTDTGQWQERRPFLNVEELRSALGSAPVIDANTRFKYSNHGYGLIGFIIEAARKVAPYVIPSIAYAHVNPSFTTRRPPRAGPATSVVFHRTWFRATACSRYSFPTTRATVADRVGESIPPRNAVMATAP